MNSLLLLLVLIFQLILFVDPVTVCYLDCGSEMLTAKVVKLCGIGLLGAVLGWNVKPGLDLPLFSCWVFIRLGQ